MDNSNDTTENEYLEMANHCKELIEKKDQIINLYKSRLSDIDSELRCMAYLISNMLYLGKYKITKDKETCKKNTDNTFFQTMKDDMLKLEHYVDNLRDMTEIDSDDEELAVLLVNM